MTDSSTTQRPLVSVLMLTYNHAQYIGEAIESVLNQQTQYPLELIICDDASTDGAQDIARQYAERDFRVVLSLQEHNTRFSKNFVDGCNRIRGKYVAFCEGDDYWTHPLKLEKQVGYLEAHPDFTVCAHRVQILRMRDQQPHANGEFIYKDCSADEERIRQGIFYADEAIDNYYFQTGSLVLRWRFMDGLPHWFRRRMMFDHFFFMLHATEGKIKYFDESMSVWRRHGGGYTWLQTQDKGLFFQKEGDDWIEMYQYMDNFFSKRFTRQIEERINLALRSMTQNCLETGNLDHLRRLVSTYKEEFQKALRNRVLVDAFRLARPDDLEFAPPWAAAQAANRPCPLPSGVGSEAPAPPLIGSAPLAIDEIPPCPGSVWEQWTGGHAIGLYANLRAALAAWMWNNGIVTVWIPACSPPLLRTMLHACQFDYRLYNTGDALRPNCDYLPSVKPGDAVLLVEYLGRSLPDDVCAAMVARPDVHWLINRAQSLAITKYAGAEAYFYSPPKLFGVPNGGITVRATNASGTLPTYGITQETGESEKYLLANLEHGASHHNRLAQAIQRGTHQLSQAPMSRTAKLLLERIPYTTVVEQRKANWAVLHTDLGEYCLWDMPKPDFAPYAFPFVCPEDSTCEIVQTLLARANIVSQRMWYPLPVSKRHFPVEDALARRLLLLPVDSRLDSEAMCTIRDAVKNILSFKHMRGLRTQIF